MKDRDFFLPVLIFPCFQPLLRKFIENKKYGSLKGRESRQRVCVFGELGVSPECSGGLLYDSRTCNNGPCRKFFLLQEFSKKNKYICECSNNDFLAAAELWGDWTACSATCGVAEKSRSRACGLPANQTCSYNLRETKPCPEFQCRKSNYKKAGKF